MRFYVFVVEKKLKCFLLLLYSQQLYYVIA